MRFGSSSLAAAVGLVAAFLVAAVTAGPVDETIQWKDCTGPADHPTIGKGNYFNLCVKGHKFRKEKYAYTFTKTTIMDSEFTDCVFANTPQKRSNLTFATWQNVKFIKTTFASYTPDPIIFDYTLLQDVLFDSCIFDSTAKIVFSNFEFRNVTFLNCEFQSDTLFELGQMTTTFFNETGFRRSPEAKTVSGSNRITFKGVTVRNAYFKEDEFVTPVVFESAAVADMHFNDTNFNDFWCHEIPEKDKEPKNFASFNDTVFSNVDFGGNFECDRVTWRGMHMSKVRFGADARMANSDILDLYWNRVTARAVDKSCHTVDLSNSRVNRKVLANTTIDCIADFRHTEFEQVFFKTFDAGRPNFEEAVFTDQEYIDGQCCTVACAKLGCKCNVTEPSGQCPEGTSKVNLNLASGACFPGDATVTLEKGIAVSFTRLRHADRIAVGGNVHSDVYFFGHRDADAMAEFVQIESNSHVRRPLYISPGHYLYVNGRLATAASVEIGDKLRGSDAEDTLVVSSVARVQRRGLYAPATMHGNLVVDGVVVSSYTNALHPVTAHRLLKPLRLLHNSPLRGIVQSLSFFMRSGSWDWLARRVNLPVGPDVIVDQV